VPTSRLAPVARGVLLTVLAAFFVFWQLRDGRNAAFFIDFRAFYCASHALAQGHDPYAAGSLYACERAQMPFGLARTNAGMVVPAPLPGYAIVALVPFATLTFVAASVAWLIVLLGCVAACARGLSILTGRPADVTLWTIIAGAAVVSVPSGELGMPMLTGLIWMAVGLKQGWWALAAIAGAVAMLEPHIGLPAMLCAYILVPQTRRYIAIAAVVLAGLDVACRGVDTALSYFTAVLPAHAHAEIPNSAQYSMTWTLHAMHFDDSTALLGGEICYGIMVLAGILAAYLLSRSNTNLAYAALVAPAFAVFGGTFIHYTQIMAAIPAAYLLFEESSDLARAFFSASLLLLMIPWLWVLSNPLLAPAFAAACAIVAWQALRFSPVVSLRIALGAAVLCGILVGAGALFGSSMDHIHAQQTLQGLAQVSWSQFVGSNLAASGPAWWIAKAPTWIGILALVAGCGYAAATNALRRTASVWAG
jgi:hypothetical protein